MYEEMMKNFKAQMAPLTEITEINKRAFEKLAELQTAYATEVFNAGITQMKALMGVKEPQAAFDLQVNFFKEMEAKLTEVAEKEVAEMNSAREELTSVFEKSVAAIAEQDYLKELSAFDLSKMIPGFDITKPAARTARKAAAPKAAE